MQAISSKNIAAPGGVYGHLISRTHVTYLRNKLAFLRAAGERGEMRSAARAQTSDRLEKVPASITGFDEISGGGDCRPLTIILKQWLE